MLRPFAAAEADHIGHGTHRPVEFIADPDADQADAHEPAEDRAHAYADDPHGKRGNDHAEGSVAGGAHPVGGDEGQRPEDRLEDAEHQHDLQGHLQCLAGKACHLRDRQRQRIDPPGHDQEDDGAQRGEPFDVVFRLIHSSGADTGARDRDQGDVDAHGRRRAHQLQRGNDGVRSDRGGAERGDRALDHQFSELEHGVFHAGRDTDLQHPEHLFQIRAQLCKLSDIDLQPGPSHKEKHHDADKDD